ncbi:amidophosphoribosyltransferase [Helicobacter suis]|uniref:amidophosphoribosyltransferase n=1 Tax=Helicobacter suis TaxID=104628 RepID=UPI000CF0CB5E|nr:hypothetical protein [Helicobacter suis]
MIGFYHSSKPPLHQALLALQHRGQQGMRFIFSNGKNLINPPDLETTTLESKHAIGQNLGTHQDFQNNHSLALAFCGRLSNTNSPASFILNLLEKSQAKSLISKVQEILPQLQGGYSFLLLSAETLIAIRDVKGFRPLSVGFLNEGFMLASETCVLQALRATNIREVEAGEILVFSKEGMQTLKQPTNNPSPCVFEAIYFSHPASQLFNQSVYTLREHLGKILAKEQPLKADLVIPIPNSGTLAALSYAKSLNLPFAPLLNLNPYVGRSFIEPTQKERLLKAEQKFMLVPNSVKDKSLILIDDSLVRGTTSSVVIQMLKRAGAKHISLLLSAPPLLSACFWGIDIPEESELLSIAGEEALKIGADFVGFLSLDGLREAIGMNFCENCFKRRDHV